MIAYNNTWLYNLQVQDAANKAWKNNCISSKEYNNIKEAHPAAFFSSSLFIRFGLFILTGICTSFMLGFLMLLIADAFTRSYYIMLIFQGLVCYAGLEFFIKEKKHYQSGVDDGLIWISAGMLIPGFCFAFNAGAILSSVITLVITAYYAYRFADRLATVFAVGALISAQFFICSKAGIYAKAIVPFIIMAVSALLYVASKNAYKKESLRLYNGCLLVVDILSLAIFYTAGNYFVVRELSNSMFDLHLTEAQDIPFGFIFKILTSLVPVVYILSGIKSRDIVLLRLGLIALVASILSFRYFHHIISTEAGLTIAGIVLIAIAAFFIRFLQTPKRGFAFRPQPAKDPFVEQLEGLLIAETMPALTVHAPQQGTEFGGGSFGGGGAGEGF